METSSKFSTKREAIVLGMRLKFWLVVYVGGEPEDVARRGKVVDVYNLRDVI